MKHPPLIALSIALAGAPALASPSSSQPTVGRLAELTFEVGSAELALDDEVTRKLGSIAAWADDHPDGLVVVDGHADKRGPSSYNVRLSLQRAQTVRYQLVELGVDPEQLVVAAYGERAPRARTNRRVVVWGARTGMDVVVANHHPQPAGHAAIPATHVDLERRTP